MAKKKNIVKENFFKRHPIIKDIFLVLFGIAVSQGYECYRDSNKFVLENVVVSYDTSNSENIAEKKYFIILKNVGTASLERIILNSDNPNSNISILAESTGDFESFNNVIYLNKLNPSELACTGVLKDSAELFVTSQTDFELKKMDKNSANKILSQYNVPADFTKISYKYLNR